MKKKILGILLSIGLVLTMLPVTAFAAQQKEFSYTLQIEGAKVVYSVYSAQQGENKTEVTSGWQTSVKPLLFNEESRSTYDTWATFYPAFDDDLDSAGIKHVGTEGNFTVNFTDEHGYQSWALLVLTEADTLTPGTPYAVYYGTSAESGGAITINPTPIETGNLMSDEPPAPQTKTKSVELLKAKTSGKRAVKLTWTKVPDASEYVIYGQKCGKKTYKKLKTVKASTIKSKKYGTYTVKKIKGKKLRAHKTYKFYVVAQTPNGNVKSKSIHFITGKTQGRYANAKSISVKPTSLTLEPGKTATLKVATKIYKNKKHIKKSHGAATRYVSNCPAVAKVSSTGKITAKAPGTATIYVQDIGGLWCKTVVTVRNSEPQAPVFSVSATKKVTFSPGNLQATINASGTPTAWKFATHQYDYIGEGGANKTIGQTSGDIDLFGWSTAATSYGISTSKTNSDYAGDFVDWGTKIGDGNTWRTLSDGEWTYLFKTRTNAASLYKCGVTVCGIEKCLIIAPDNWDISTNPLQALYDETSWATAEAAGLVCLPSAGSRNGSLVNDLGSYGYYWTADAVDENRAYYTKFSNASIETNKSISRYLGYSVRLVKDAE